MLPSGIQPLHDTVVLEGRNHSAPVQDARSRFPGNEDAADLLRHINKELGISLLVIEHDLPLLAGLADRMVAMEAGRVIAAGTPEQVRAHPEVVRSYLGVAHA